MAPARAKKDSPWWVKQRRFVVPSTLQVKIQGLPEDEQWFYCFIVSKVIVTSKKHPTLYHPISSKYFKDFIGSKYRDLMETLEGWEVIDINDQYLNDPVEGFCKSYRLHPKVLAEQRVKICFKKKQVHPLKDKSELTDDVAEFVHHNLKRLTVRADLLPQADVTDEVDAEIEAEKIYFQQWNVSYGRKARRLFHNVILMSKAARRNLVLKADPSIPLYEYDVKSCMPVILLGLAKDPAEKAKLKTLLDGDIYTTIAKECGVTKDRDDIKLDFMYFLNGSIKNYVHKFFHRHLPKLTELVMKSKEAEKGMAWFGQRVESEIMVQEIPHQLMQSGTPSNVHITSNKQVQNTSSTAVQNIQIQNKSNQSLTCGGNPEDILYIPMHDGWLGIEHDEQQIAVLVRNEFFRRLGYWVTITKTELATGKERVLVAGEPKTKETPAQRKRKEIIGQLYTLWLVHGKRGPFPPPDLEEQVAKYM
jgi:hypothetical protein